MSAEIRFLGCRRTARSPQAEGAGRIRLFGNVLQGLLPAPPNSERLGKIVVLQFLADSRVGPKSAHRRDH